MKNIKNLLAISFAAIILTASTLFAAPVQDQDVQTLEQQIYKEIVTMPYYDVFDHIAFELNGSTVVLSGKVYNGSTRKNAERRVKKIDGVSSVINNIEILSASRFDNNIRRDTLRAFSNTGGLYRYLVGPTPSMRIIVDRGHITLEGFVAGEGDLRLANILANSVPGVFSVTNNLIISDNRKY